MPACRDFKPSRVQHHGRAADPYGSEYGPDYGDPVAFFAALAQLPQDVSFSASLIVRKLVDNHVTTQSLTTPGVGVK